MTAASLKWKIEEFLDLVLATALGTLVKIDIFEPRHNRAPMRSLQMHIQAGRLHMRISCELDVGEQDFDPRECDVAVRAANAYHQPVERDRLKW